MLGVLRIICVVIVMLLEAVIIVSVMLQKSKSEGLSSVMGGNETDTYFGKSKAASKDAKLGRVTKISMIIFVVFALVLTILFGIKV